MFWSVGPFWYMVYEIWYVVYGMKMAFTMYSHMFFMHHAQAVYNVVHLFLVVCTTCYHHWDVQKISPFRIACYVMYIMYYTVTKV